MNKIEKIEKIENRLESLLNKADVVWMMAEAKYYGMRIKDGKLKKYTNSKNKDRINKKIDSVKIYHKATELYWKIKIYSEQNLEIFKNQGILFDSFIHNAAEKIDTIYQRIKILKMKVDGHLSNRKGDKIIQISSTYSSWAVNKVWG